MIPSVFASPDKYLNIRLLREYDFGLTPWHIGCKLFRRFKQISL